MDDKTIFENSPQAKSQPFPNIPPVEPMAGQVENQIPQENPFGPPPAVAEEIYRPSAPTPPPPPPHSSFLPLGNIVKILAGIAVLAVLLFLIFKVVPGFFNKSSSQVTLTYWGLWQDSSVMQGIIGDFERENPNIKIDYSRQDVKQYREKLATRLQNNTGPDIFAIHNTWLPMFSSSLLPMSSDVITQEVFSKNFYPVVQKDLARNGAIYAIPLGIDTLSMYVNTQLFQAAGVSVPTNWQDFISVSRQLTVKDETGKIQTSGAALGTFDNIAHAPDIISLLLVQNGAKLDDLSSTLKQASDALSFYTSFAAGEASVWDATLEPSMISFAKGSLAMYFGYSWDFFSIKAANPNLQFDIVPVPALVGQKQTIASYWAYGVSAKSSHQKEAFIFMKYLAQKETEQKLYAQESKTRLFGQPYANVDLAQSLKDSPVVFPFIAQAPDAVSSFFASDTYDNALNSQMNTYLGNAIRSILNDTSPATAAETLSQGVSQVLSQYGN